MARQKLSKRQDGTYQYRVSYTDPVTGEKKRKSFYAKKRAEAEQKGEDFLRSLMAGETEVCSRSQTFEEWARRWLETYKKPMVSVGTYENTYRSLLEGHIIPYFRGADLDSIRPVDVQEYFAGKTGCSQDRLDHMRSILYAVFEAAVENDLCRRNPVRLPKVKSTREKRKPVILTDEQIAAVQEQCQLPEIRLMLDTGLRRGELLGLMWSDYDADAQTLAVNRSIALEGTDVVVHPPKWDSYRVLPLSDAAVQLLDSLPRSELYIFPRRGGGPQNPHAWSEKFSRHFRRMHEADPAIPIALPHDMRRTYGTMLRRRGADIYTIQKLLGHKDIKVTSEIYVANELDVLRAQLPPTTPLTTPCNAG